MGASSSNYFSFQIIMCQAQEANPRRIISILSTANHDKKKKNNCLHQTRPTTATLATSSTTMKLPRCGNNSSHHHNHHQFTASSSSSSAAAAGALQGRAEDAELNNNEMRLNTKPRASKPTSASSSSSNGQVQVVRRCQSANAPTSRRHSIPSNGDAFIHKSRSHNVSKTTTTTNNHFLHFHRPSCSRAKEAVVDEDIDEDGEPSGVRTPELPIPAPTSHSHGTSGDGTRDGTGGNVDEGDLTRMYDFATWNMYERIVSARRQRLTSTAASSTNSRTTTTTSSATTASSSSSQAPSRKKNQAMEGGESKRQASKEKNGGQQCNNSKASSFSWLTQEFKSANTKIHGSSAVTVAAVATASSEAAVADMTSSKPQLYCKRSSIVSDCESATLATADETDKSSTTSSSWSRNDSPGTFPAVGGSGGGFGGGNEAFLNPLRTAGNGSNPNCRTSYHPTMMMHGVDHCNNRHQAGFYTNIGGSSMMMNGGVCLGGITTSSGVALPGRSSTLPASHEDDTFIFQLEM